jgi:phage terminase large subunit-like protein
VPASLVYRVQAKQQKALEDRKLRVVGNQPGQASFLRDLAPGATAYIGGLGSGKTWSAARKFLFLHGTNKCPGLAVAPTYGDLWRFVVPALVAACDELAWSCTVHPSGRGMLKFPHLSIEGVPVLTLSAEDPERFAGFEVGHIWIDEGARLKESRENPLRDAPTQIRSRLRHGKAKRLHLLTSTTPEGTDTWVHRDFIAKPLPLHRVHKGKTSANAALPPSYIESLRAALPAELATQYLDGEAIDYCADRAHPTFTLEKHMRPAASAPWRRAPVHVGADFNVSPLCWTAGQQQPDGSFVVMDEIVIEDFGLVDSAVRIANDKGWHSYGPVILHPDRSGNNRNRIGDPEVATIQAAARGFGWDFRCDAFGANPPVNARINLTSRMLLDGTGATRLRVLDRCPRLINEFGHTGRKSSGYDPGARGDRGHILDAIGYTIWDLYAPGLAAQAANWRL